MLIFVVSFAVSFGLIFGFSRVRESGFNISLPFPQSEEEAPAEPTPEPTEVPTPTPSVDREELQVKILNGSGIPGKAGEVEDILIEAGYADIVTGNADNFEYEVTEVQLSEDAADALTFLQDDLADFVDITDAATIDDEDETADVIIIVGPDFE